MTNINTRSFEVSLHERLQQSRHAKNAVRLPKQGYSLYRVYEGPKSELKKPVIVQTRYGALVFDSLFASQYTPHTVRWLKSKHVTLLKMKGICVEPAKPDDKGTHIGP